MGSDPRTQALLGGHQTAKHAGGATAKAEISIAGPFWLMVFGAALCTLNNSLVKGLTLGLPALIQGRYLVQWLAGLIALALRSLTTGAEFHPFGPPGTRRWLLFRGFLYFWFIWLWWLTLRMVPVGDAVAVVKTEAFVSGLASAALFGERLTKRWWLCCAASCVGVVMVVRPPIIFGGTDDASMWGRWLNMLTPCISGFLPCLVKLAPTAHFLEIQHSCDFLCAVIFAPPLLLLGGGGAALLAVEVWWTVLLVAIVGMTALCTFTLAYQMGLIGRVAIVGYTEVPLAYASQVLLFGTPPDLVSVSGAVLIVLSAVMGSTERQKSAVKDLKVFISPNLVTPNFEVPVLGPLEEAVDIDRHDASCLPQ